MTTVKNPLARASPLRCLTPMRVGTPLKSSLTTIQPILPDIVSSLLPQKPRVKKRVRFALKLEPVEEDLPSTPDQETSTSLSSTRPTKRIIDPWRENGPLYGAYVEYFDAKDCSTPEFPEPIQASATESSIYTHTFILQNKSPEITIDSITVTTPTRHLPRVVQRTKPTKTMSRKPLSPVIDPYLKQRVNASPPPRQIQSRKIQSNPKTLPNSIQPIIKRADFSLPSIKTINSNDKVLRTEQCLGTKIVNEYLQTKKLTEIITNPLPGTNNQLNTITGHSILPNLTKNQIHNEPYFFQNHISDHFQPIIH